MLDENSLGRLMVAEVEDGERPSTVLDVDRAITTGRRQRRIGRGLLAGGVLSVVAAASVVAPSIVDKFDGTGGERPAAPPATSVVTAYSGIHDPAVDTNTEPGFDRMSPAHDYSLVLNPETGRYDRMPYPRVVPSPDARRVLVWQGDNSVRYPLRVGVLDRATGSVGWAADGAMPLNRLSADSDGVWSPDGGRILFTGDHGASVLDAETLAATPVPVPGLDGDNARGLAAAWTPDGTGFTLPLTRVEEGRGHRLTVIRTWDLTGTVRGDVAVSYDANVEGADLSFSPDLGLLAVTRAAGIDVLDARTGTLARTVAVPGALVGWRDAGHLVTVAADRLTVVSLTGSTVRTVPLEKTMPQRYRIGSATGLPASTVTF
jgi:hypothetical protein